MKLLHKSTKWEEMKILNMSSWNSDDNPQTDGYSTGEVLWTVSIHSAKTSCVVLRILGDGDC